MSTLLRFHIAVFFFLIGICAHAQDLTQLGKRNPFSYSGGISSRLVFYNASGIPQRRDPFGYVFSGNINARIYDVSLPFSFTYTNQGTSYGQPFNQFGLSPTYKWATLHLGYRNISYSPFTLAGHSMLGAGVELNPGKLRFGFVYGRLRRSVQFRPPPDSLSLDTLLQTQKIPYGEEPVYQRMGWATKVGYGDDKGFVDLILFRGKDDESSIDDDSLKSIYRPAENAVIGINARRTFLKKFTFFFEGAMSAYTRDSGGEGEADSVDGPRIFNPLITVNNTTYFYHALKTGLGYSGSNFNVQTEYQRIAADYKSMGAYFFNNDVESFTVTPSFYLFKNKAIVTSGVSYQKDNLNKKKLFTTQRIIPRVNITLNPSYKFGIDLGYMDMMSTQSAGSMPVVDSLRMNMSNPGLTAGLRYNIADSTKTHSFMLMGNRFSLDDKNALTETYSEYQATIVNFNYSFFLVRQNIGVNLSLTTNELQNYSGSLKSTGASVGFSKVIFDNKVNINGSWSANFSGSNDSQSSNLSIGYTPGKKFSVNTQVNFLEATQGEMKFQELTGYIEVRYSFAQNNKQQ